ncbi:sodium/glutamate symporter [Gammaproteobacteria bacterium]|nr:sodium/glutamate symporter [Gammaproteobacteria bacterium]
MALDERQTLIAAILVLFLGKYLTRKVSFLRDYNIPQPVTGGVLASLVVGAVFFLFDTTISFDLNMRDVLLITFFTTIGLSSRVSTLMKGGRKLLILVGIAVVYLLVQNLTGLFVASVAGLDLNIGLIAGSVSLSGGHGTAIAWAPTFREQYGIVGASEIGVACATFGLVLGGVMGGPIAKFLITRHRLQPESKEQLVVGLPHAVESRQVQIDVDSVLHTLLVIAWSMGLGLIFNEVFESFGLRLPAFVTSLFAGIVLTNTVPLALPKLRDRWPTSTPPLALISDLSLGLFLAMSLMSLQLWTLADLAGSILLLLIAQVIVITGFTIFVVFQFMGRDYDAAVISGGYAGLGLGATPTAIANMEAITQKFGPSPMAFLVIPLVGAFFIDISNAVIIRFFLDLIN